MKRRRSISPSSPTSCSPSDPPSSSIPSLTAPPSPPTSSLTAPPSPPTSSLTAMVKCEKTRGVVYSVFEAYGDVEEYRFLIYKLDSGEAGKFNAQVQELGHPISLIRKADCPYSFMSIFSIGSKLYFVGGYQTESCLPMYSTKAYKVDTSLFNSDLFNSNPGEGEVIPAVKLTRISPMNSPKRRPWVFGPIDGHKFYIISETLFNDMCSFEVFDTSIDMWESLPLPDVAGLIDLDHLLYLYRYQVRIQSVFNILSSAIFGSYICLSTHSALFLFCTKEKVWKAFCRPCFNTKLSCRKPTSLPFLGQAYSLFKKENLFLTLTFEKCVPPVVYKSHPDLRVEDFERGNIFKDDQGWYLEGLERLKEFPEMLGSNFSVAAFCYVDDPRIFIVRFGEDPEVMPDCCEEDPEVSPHHCKKNPEVSPHRNRHTRNRHTVINICDVSLMDGDKVKIENAVTYKHHSNSEKLLLPRHFFVVGRYK